MTSVLKLFYLAGAFSQRAVTPEFANLFDVARYALLGLAAALLLVERLEVRLSANASDAARAIEATERESEERFRLIANTAPVMIWMSDVDKQITYVNKRWLEFTGWPPDDVAGTSLHPNSFIPTMSSDAGMCMGRPSTDASPFRWSIGSAATTARIAGR